MQQPFLVRYPIKILKIEGTSKFANLGQSNEVLNFDKGRVIYVGKQDMLGQYVTVLLENNIEVTFGQMTDVFVSAYDQVDAATILGTYQNQVMIIFTQGEKEIDYSTFEELIS